MSEALEHKQKELTFDADIRNHDDTTTWLAEVLDGTMRTEFHYHFNGEDLVARDGSEMRPIFKRAVKDAKHKAEWDPRLDFEVRRRKCEYEEYQEMLAMARGKGANTMVVVSDFPREVLEFGEDKLGYNTRRKQTMLRVITRDENGIITMVSQSLDQSDRSSLEAMYDFMGVPVVRGELLGQRMHINLESAFQKHLPETLTHIYDQTLVLNRGGEWYAGRASEDRRNTMEFALKQTDLISVYLAGPKNETAAYNLASAVQARFDNKHSEFSRSDISISSRQSYLMAVIEMEQMGRKARTEGKIFSGCGASIGPEQGAEEELQAAGYGANDKKSSSDMKCVNCPACKTFHEKVRTIAGKLVCDNPKCKLSDKKK